METELNTTNNYLAPLPPKTFYVQDMVSQTNWGATRRAGCCPLSRGRALTGPTTCIPDFLWARSGGYPAMELGCIHEILNLGGIP